MLDLLCLFPSPTVLCLPLVLIGFWLEREVVNHAYCHNDDGSGFAVDHLRDGLGGLCAQWSSLWFPASPGKRTGPRLASRVNSSLARGIVVAGISSDFGSGKHCAADAEWGGS